MPAVHIQINKSHLLEISSKLPDEGLLEQAAKEVLKHHGAKTNTELTLVVTDDDQIEELNRQFLSLEGPTDVLAFPSGETDPDSQKQYLGDVIISFPRALIQAEERGHSEDAELQLLVVHGVLHLLGYDHTEGEQKEIMWKVQADILDSLGCAINIMQI